MADTQDEAASEAGRQLVRARWGNQAVVKAAALVVQRADELSPTLRAVVAAAVTTPDDAKASHASEAMDSP